jgi:glycosyltransferase involved in cell wall biosynthesis
MGVLLPSIASKGIKVDLLHVNGKGPHIEADGENLRVVKLGSSHSFTSLIPLIRYLKRERPDALLSDKDRVNQVAIVARILARVPTRVIVRSGTTISKALESRGILEKVRHYISMRYLYKYADAIITASQGSAEDLSRFAGIPLSDISVIPNPVNQEEILELASGEISHPWFKGTGTPVIVGLGELGGSKDYKTLIRAFAALKADREVKLYIMGGGRGQQSLQKLVDDLGLEEDVEFAGFTKNPFPYLGRADLFVLSSNFEGFGMALLEALSLGIPSVATDCPSGPRDILQDGRYGQLVPIGNAEEMAKAMGLALDAPPESSYLKEGAVPYSLEKVLDMYLQCLNLKEPGQ